MELPERGSLIFCYADPRGFSGQRAATELAIAGLSARGWKVRRLPQPVFDRERGGLLSAASYGLGLAASWLRSLSLLAARGSWLCVNLGQTRTGLIRDAVPLVLGRLGLGRSRVLVSLHGSLFMRWDERATERRWFCALMRQAGLVTVLGENQRERLVAMGLPTDQVAILLNSCELEPISLPDFAAKRASAETGERPIRCLHLSSLIAAKGFPEYLDALAVLNGRPGPSIEAILCGRVAASEFGERFSTPAAAERWIEARLAELNRGGRVRATWVKGARGAEKQALFRAADIFVLPTRYAVEAQPLVLLEAMASGCAIATSGVGEIRTLLNERSAWMMDEPSVRTVADAIETLASDAERRSALSAAARERFLSQFSLERHWDDWERLLGRGSSQEAVAR